MRALGRGRSHTHLEDLPGQAGLSWKKLAFPVIVFLVFPGAVAYASIFSFLNDRVTDFITVKTQVKTYNSQNLLLAAAVGPELPPKDSATDVNTVDGSAVWADAGPSGGLADVDGTDADHGQISIYVVREKDTFSAIAKMFDVSVNTILWANNLSRGAQLTVGQTLVILPVSGVQYTVKKGDTIAGIAKKFNGVADEIRLYNGIAPGEMLSIGTEIIIPDGELATPTPASSSIAARLRGAGGPAYEGYYRAPFFSYRKTQGLHGYNGVDLVATTGAGTPVMASAGGQVIISRQGGYNGGYGNYVVLQHGNGTQTLYGHLRSTAVSSGSIVASGEVIGYMGNTGRSTGAHLHFEVRGGQNPFAACPLNVSCSL